MVAAHIREAQHLAQCRLRLQVVILGNAAAQNQRGQGARLALEQPPAMIGAGLEHFGVQVQVERVFGHDAGVAHGPQLHRIQENAAIRRGAHQHRDGEAIASGQQAGRHSVALFLRGVICAQTITHLRAGHLLLKLGARQAGAQEAVLIEQHGLVEGHIGNADRAFVAQRRVVAVDGHFVYGIVVRVQAAMPVVIADRVGRADVGHPSGFEQRDEPREVLARHGNRAGDGQRQRATLADGAIENGVDAPQIRAAESRQTVPENLVESGAFIDAPDADGVAVGHRF